MSDDPARFYTGLVAQLYEPLVSYRATADDYAPFLDRSGTPALELCCGTGMPLLDLLARGYDVEGLDCSPDMLALCRESAARRGLHPVLYEQTMQAMQIERRFRSIFLAGASFTLLGSDADASRALAQIHRHLVPGGAVLIPLSVPDLRDGAAPFGATREVRDAEGTLLRVTVGETRVDQTQREVRTALRYERIPVSGGTERVDRTLVTRWWQQDRFATMLRQAGFDRIRFLALGGDRAAPDASFFLCIAARPAAPVA
jgi:ubiquinone/menaquinone biosynthesis C-methylase UbiE